MMVPAPPPGLPPLLKRFYWIMSLLIQAAAERGGSRPSAVLRHIVFRLCRIRGRFTVLAGRVLAGLVKPRLRRAGEGRAGEGRAHEGGADGSGGHEGGAPRKPPPPPNPVLRPLPLPRGWGWVVRHVPQTAAACGTYLKMLLDEPEMAALLAASAELRRMLRPLMRALGQPPHPALRAKLPGPGIEEAAAAMAAEVEPAADTCAPRPVARQSEAGAPGGTVGMPGSALKIA